MSSYRTFFILSKGHQWLSKCLCNINIQSHQKCIWFLCMWSCSILIESSGTFLDLLLIQDPHIYFLALMTDLALTKDVYQFDNHDLIIGPLPLQEHEQGHDNCHISPQQELSLRDNLLQLLQGQSKSLTWSMYSIHATLLGGAWGWISVDYTYSQRDVASRRSKIQRWKYLDDCFLAWKALLDTLS